jgi:hypothetical protein
LPFIVSNAAATARQIQIINQLDPHLDPGTIRLRLLTFGTNTITVPGNRSFYQARVQLGPEFSDLLADISAGLDIQSLDRFTKYDHEPPKPDSKWDSTASPFFGLLRHDAGA